MTNYLEKLSEHAIEQALEEAGFTLTHEQIREIRETEESCLHELKRVSFGESAATKLIREFAHSSFIEDSQRAKTLSELIEAFYELREEFDTQTGDTEIIEALYEVFEGEAAGDVSLSINLAYNSLRSSVDSFTYEIVDEEGKVYRFDPDEWHDDIEAQGWEKERWDDDTEIIGWG